jgi:hypothetical protein
MEEVDGAWVSVDTFDLAAGAEFKVRQGMSWDVNFGDSFNGGNFIVETAGTYKIKFTWDGAQNGTIELIAQ